MAESQHEVEREAALLRKESFTEKGENDVQEDQQEDEQLQESRQAL